jgi:hypothetical protein
MKAQNGKKYISTLALTSALNACDWPTPRPNRFTPGNDPVSNVREDGWVPGLVWVAENLLPIRIRSPDHSSSSKSLHQLHYPGPSPVPCKPCRGKCTNSSLFLIFFNQTSKLQSALNNCGLRRYLHGDDFINFSPHLSFFHTYANVNSIFDCYICSVLCIQCAVSV